MNRAKIAKRSIFSAGNVSTYSFDYKNGGPCEKISDDYVWIENKETINTESDEDEEWIMV